ncbi:hypothetical protein [Clostridium sp. ZS2-4]|uniref:hypothetical protein n=1 Tax=Clostridium sp. ZS2-4 TaxID=2987703 RepID=UPI00227A27C8|nr:hypothetical protein [Clostridium sp. ZS2-4]MCY6354804.1 hypothetical protein [Clostridium sp. ZS2-4]
MNKKLIILIMCLLTSILILLGYKSKKTAHIYLPATRAVNESELKEFLDENNISPIDVQNTSGFTIVLFENEESKGHYMLYKYKDESDGKELLQGSLIVPNTSKEPQVFIGGVATGIPFMTIIVNDKELLKKTYKVIDFYNGISKTKLLNGKKGIIIVQDKPKKGYKQNGVITLCDKNNNVLYEDEY